jgi:hypothetical protein
MFVERSLADRSMLTAGGVQFVVGCVLEGEQSIVGTGYGQEVSSSRKSCRDAHDDPCPGRDDDEDRSQGPRREPVSPGQPPADERFGQPTGGRLSHGTRPSLLVLAELPG